MGQFAKILDDGTVIHIVYIPDSYINENGEHSVIEEIKRHNDGGIWIRSWENGYHRRQPAVKGGRYDFEHDVFIDPPFEHLNSWVLHNGKYVPPVPMPEDLAPGWPEGGRKGWEWDEDSVSWVAVEFPLIWDEDSQQWIPRND